MEAATYPRRSGRIARRIPITLRWQPLSCDVQDDAAETAVLSRHGCKIVCQNHLKIGREVFVMDSGRGKSIRARVVYWELKRGNVGFHMALEFLGSDNFWEIEFPPAPYFPLIDTNEN